MDTLPTVEGYSIAALICSMLECTVQYVSIIECVSASWSANARLSIGVLVNVSVSMLDIDSQYFTSYV